MLSPPIAPMLAQLARALPEGDYVYEPKWDGFRCLAFVEAGAIALQSRHGKPLARYFPEVVGDLAAVPGRFVLDGELVIEGDFAALMNRTHPAASRVARLAAESPARYVAFDLLAIEDEDLRGRGFAERRARLLALLDGTRVRATEATSDPALAARWLDARGAGIDGVVAKASSLPYLPGKRAMIKVKPERTIDCVVAGARLAGPAIASLLLGLWDGGVLRHVGVVSQLADAKRRALLEELRGDVVPLAGHPWERGFQLDRSPTGRLAGSAGRWVPGEMTLDWIPLAPRRVLEVAYDHVDERRLRHPARFVRWRPDRDAASCGIEQLC